MRRIYSVAPLVWSVLCLVVLAASLVAWMRFSGALPAQWITYIVQPITLIAACLVVMVGTQGKADRARHKSDKAVIVGSVVAIWFVLQFATGILFTYSRNALVVDLRGVFINIIAYGSVAVSIELLRQRLMLMVGRRNAVWFGVVVAVVLALPMMNLGQVAEVTSAERLVKMLFIDIFPSLIMSALLTYLTLAAGLPAQLTFRLGVLAATLLPPIIPKYDWYLIGISYMLLCMAVYIVLDRGTRQSTAVRARRTAHVRIAYEIMSYVILGAMVLFMTGLFSYRPMAIVSNSMKPLYSRGAMVVVETRAAVDIHIGDIVQYQSTGKTITHRVLSIDYDENGTGERVFITKGDNSPSQDPPVSAAQILGVVRFYIPYIGYPTVWLRELSI
jgi:signal peptidase